MAALPQGLDELLCFAVYAANGAFNRAYRPMLDRLGLTYPQYLVLIALGERDDRTVGEIGAALHLESNTLTPMLKRLEAAGHVTRRRDGADERQVRIRLTAAGRALLGDACLALSAIGERLPLAIDEVARLREALVLLTDVLDRGATDARKPSSDTGGARHGL